MPKYTQNHIDLINSLLDTQWRKVVVSYLEDQKAKAEQAILARKEIEEPKYTQDHLRRLQIETYSKIINIKETVKNLMDTETDKQG